MSVKILSARDSKGIVEVIGVYTDNDKLHNDMISAQETEYKSGGWLSFVVEERELNFSGLF